MSYATFSDYLAAQREREEVTEDNQAFVCELQKRLMSTWTNEEMERYNLLTGQGHD